MLTGQAVRKRGVVEFIVNLNNRFKGNLLNNA